MHRKTLWAFSILFVIMLMVIGMVGCESSSGDNGDETPTPTPTPTGTGIGTISGTVLNESGAPLQGCAVSVNPAMVEVREDTTTDANGQFTVGSLNSGVQYLIEITYPGRVTIKAYVTLNDSMLDRAFTVTMPNGEGTSTFYLPDPIVLGIDMKGATANLTWGGVAAAADAGTVVFDRYLLYRDGVTGVNSNSTLVMEDAVQAHTTYSDVVPGIGQFFYVLYKRYEDPATGVAVSVVSNEVWGGLAGYSWQSTFWPENYCDTWDAAIYEGPRTNLQGIYIHNDYEIQKWDFEGNLLDVMDLYDYTDGYYFYGADFDSQGNLYLASDGYDYVFKITFNDDGTVNEGFIWGDEDGEPYFDYTYGLAVGKDASGQEFVYVCNESYQGVYKLTTDGQLVGSFFGTAPDIYYDYWYPYGVDVDPSTGNVYVSGYYETYEAYRGFVMVFNSDGRQLNTWYLPSYEYNYGIDVDNAGNVFVTDDYIYTVNRYDLNGNFIQQIGNYGPGNEGLFDSEPTGVATDSSGRLYVVISDYEVQVFAPSVFGTP
jgi:hypothetical protein